MDAPTVTIPKRGPSRLEIALTVFFLAIWLHQTSKPGSSWLGLISGVAILSLGIPWLVRSLEFVRASVVPWAGMGLILTAIVILAVALSFSSDASGSALIGFSMVFLVFLLIAFPVFCAAAGLAAEGWRLARLVFSGERVRGLSSDLLGFLSWVIWPAALLSMVFLSFVPVLLALRVQMSEPALAQLIEDFGASSRERIDVNERIGFLNIAAVVREKDHICLVTEKYEDMDSAGLAYVPGPPPSGVHWTGKHIYGPWWKWRRNESWFRSLSEGENQETGAP